MSDHWDDCWMQHPACALAEIKRLQVQVSQLQCGVMEPDWMRRLREPSVVPCGDTQSGGYGTVVLKLHGPGPTWARACDDPPTR